jgi:hypothetical protein
VRAARLPRPGERADPPAAAPTPSRDLLRLQRTAGNQAVGRLLQRFGPFGGPFEIDPLDLAVESAFELLVRRNRAEASEIKKPAAHVHDMARWIEETDQGDKVIPKYALQAARSKDVRFHIGGSILDLVPDADAMTLGDDVFMRHGTPTPPTFVHELIHVAQYWLHGVPGFLTRYFGESAIDIVRQWLGGEPIDPYKTSSLECAAFAYEDDFRRWASMAPTGFRCAD